jgi:hypothetical protein
VIVMQHRDYLVRHGLLGDIGRFQSPEPLSLRRGSRVVVRGPNGSQMGEVVRPAGEGGPGFGGELVRAAGPDDEARHARLAAKARALLERGNGLKASVEFLDAEIYLDGDRAAFLHVCPRGTDLANVRRCLEQESGLIVTLHDLTRAEPEPSGGCGDCGSGGGCSTGGCGSGGGCSTGGCGSAKPAEVKEYFAELRGRMERRMPLL